MPTVFTKNGIRFFFYSNENHEPIHIHMTKGDAHGKCWLEPMYELAYTVGFNSNEINFIENEIKNNIDLIKNKWYEHFGQTF